MRCLGARAVLRSVALAPEVALCDVAAATWLVVRECSAMRRCVVLCDVAARMLIDRERSAMRRGVIQRRLVVTPVVTQGNGLVRGASRRQ